MLPPLHINNISNIREFVIQFVRVYLDENISWKYHIKIVRTKFRKSIGKLYRARYTLNKFLRKQPFSFINFQLNYANVAWGSTNKTKTLSIAIRSME